MLHGVFYLLYFDIHSLCVQPLFTDEGKSYMPQNHPQYTHQTFRAKNIPMQVNQQPCVIVYRQVETGSLVFTS